MDTAQAPRRTCLVSPCHNILHRVVEAAETQSPAPFDELGVKPEEHTASDSNSAAPDIVLGPPTPQSKALGVQGAKRLLRLSPYMMALRNLVDDHAIAEWAARYLATEVYGLNDNGKSDAKSAKRGVEMICPNKINR